MLKLSIEESGVKNKEGVLLQELDGKRFAIPLRGKVALYLVNGKQAYPLLSLGFIGNNLRIEFLWHTVERDAIVALHHKLLFQP